MSNKVPFTPTRVPPEPSDTAPITLTFPTHNGSKAGQIAQITLCAPKRLNPLNADSVQLLVAYLEWINDQPDIIITIFTGQGRFLSSGADISDPSRTLPDEVAELEEDDTRRTIPMRSFFSNRVHMNNGRLTSAFYNHNKLLVAALNGPVVGISAAIIAYADLLYCFEDFYLLTPFSSLALVAEGGSSTTFVKKMGLGRAQQALLQGKKMTAKELHDSGFISAIFPTPTPPSKADKSYTPPILDHVLPHLVERFLPPTADPYALLYTKNLIRGATYENKSWIEAHDAEMRGVEKVFLSGRVVKQFERLASGGRHKL